MAAPFSPALKAFALAQTATSEGLTFGWWARLERNEAKPNLCFFNFSF